MAKLAIKGHKERGEEVIKILEMLGGKNSNCSGKNIYAIYSIPNNVPNNGYIYPYQYAHQKYPDDFIIFTLEEFLKRFPYKVGDKVSSKYLKNYKIEKMEWEDTNNRVIYKLQGMGWYSAEELQPYKEEVMDRKYNVEEYLKVWEETEKGLKVVVNDKFELKEDNGKFYIIKKQPQYPKTYEECWYMLKHDINNDKVTGYKNNILSSLQKLLICRDAYWKIAGEQMGLGKPWEPDWSDGTDKYVITTYKNCVVSDILWHSNCLLAFPTKEMRDTFYENFKELIEECKELL